MVGIPYGDRFTFTPLQEAIRARYVATSKLLWDHLVAGVDGRYVLLLHPAPLTRSRSAFLPTREVFGGPLASATGGWDSKSRSMRRSARRAHEL